MFTEATVICQNDVSVYYISDMFFFFFFPSANLTGHAEKVGIENFELLKVLGTGGKMRCFSKLNVGSITPKYSFVFQMSS